MGTDRRNGWLNCNLTSFFFYVILVAVLAYFLVIPLNSTVIRQAVTVFASLVFYVIIVQRLIYSKYDRGLVLRMSFIAFIIATGIALSDEISFETIYRSMNFFCLFVILTTENNLQITKKAKMYAFAVCILITLVLFALSLSPFAYVMENGQHATRNSLVLGMTNPNLTAMLLFCLVSVFAIFYYEFWYNKLIFIVSECFLLYLIWLTDSRTSLLTSLLFLFVVSILKLRRFNPSFLILPMIIPFIFVPLYLFLMNKYGMSDINIMEKGMGTRYEIFNAGLERLNSFRSILIGNHEFSPFENLHNAPLTIQCSLGVLGLVVCYYSYFVRLLQINEIATTKSSRVSLCAMLAVYVLSSCEANMFVGTFPCLFFVFVIMLTADTGVPMTLFKSRTKLPMRGVRLVSQHTR